MSSIVANTGSETDATADQLRLSMELLNASMSGDMNLLRGVELDSVWGLLKRCKIRELSDGETLLEMEQLNNTMYLVLRGRLNVYLDAGRQKEVAVLAPGQTVGELSVIDSSRVSALVSACGETAVLCIEEGTFWQLIKSSHQFCTNLLLLLSRRMRSNNFSLLESDKLQMQFERESVTDGLTGVYNRHWLNQKLGRLLQRSQKDGRELAILMLDIDHFKRYNDSYGHLSGDAALCSVATRLSTRLRAQDLIARYGGEEFCVILPETSLAEAETTARHLLEAVARTEVKNHDGDPLPSITVSIGVACSTVDEDAHSLMSRADKALYRAKANGRNRVEVI